MLTTALLPLGKPVRELLGWISFRKIYPKCGQHHSVGWDPGLSRAIAFISLSLTGGAKHQLHAPPIMSSHRDGLYPDCEPTLPEVALVRYFITEILIVMRQVINKIALFVCLVRREAYALHHGAASEPWVWHLFASCGLSHGS